MLSDDEFKQWCCCLKLSEKAQQEIQHVRSSAPSRRVRGAHNNVTGRYPSRKMGLSIQFESHKVELPFIYQLEHDEDVLEYYDQPPSFKLSYQEASGRNLGFYITPDFFVICTNSVGWVECKPEDKLNQLAQKSSRRYVLDDDNQWHSPPAEQYAQQFGFFFRLWSNAEINWTLHRNLEFLADYYKSDAFEVTKATRNTILSMISAQPGITLANLLHHGEGVSTDDIYHLIANEEIYVNLTASPLVEAQKCLLFIDQLYEETYNAIILSQSTTNTIHSPGVELIPGITVLYSGKSLTITLVGETEVLLQTSEQQIVTLSLSTFDELVKQGKITKSTTQKTDEINNQVMDLFKKASFPDLMAANRRYHLIQPYLDGQPIKTNTPQERSLRIWLTAYRQAQQKYGYGYLGILHFENKKGNRNRKLPQHILNLIDKFIIERYETKKQKRKQSVYNEFVHFCVETGISELQVPSYKTFIKEIKKRSGYEQTLKREGLRSAYRLEPFYWELEVTTPRHGDFPFHICHIDHTESDIELRCSKTGKVLGRAWITLLVDAFSRRILAVYASYDPPSYRSCMMVLRICVKRYGRLPQTIVTDNESRAKVQPGKGIKVEQKYYWSNTFRDPEIENTSVNVRYDPFNAGIAYAYVRGQWVECISEYYSLFRGRSEKEIQIATTQLKKQKQNHASSYRIRAKQLGEFLASLEVEEILLEQRLRDKQAQEVFQVIEGELPLLSPYNQTPNVDEEKEQDKLNSSTESELEVNELVNPQKLKIFKIY